MSTPLTARRSLGAAVVEEIRVAMVRRHWRQSDLANALNTNEAWLSRRLAGKTDISPDDLQKIAAALGVPVIELLPRWAFEVQAQVAGGEARTATGADPYRTTVESPDGAVRPPVVPGQRTPTPPVRPVDTGAPRPGTHPSGVTPGHHVLTERAHDRRPAGRAPTSTPSAATRRPGVIRSHHGTMAR